MAIFKNQGVSFSSMAQQTKWTTGHLVDAEATMTIIQLRTGNTQIDQKAILAANDQRYSRRVGAWIIYSFTCIKICIYIYTYIHIYIYM